MHAISNIPKNAKGMSAHEYGLDRLVREAENFARLVKLEWPHLSREMFLLTVVRFHNQAFTDVTGYGLSGYITKDLAYTMAVGDIWG